MSNHRNRVNYSGEENIAILGGHFVNGLLQEHVQLKKANGDPCVDAGALTTPVIRSLTL